jgi:hypothetical protein
MAASRSAEDQRLVAGMRAMMAGPPSLAKATPRLPADAIIARAGHLAAAAGGMGEAGVRAGVPRGGRAATARELVAELKIQLAEARRPWWRRLLG